MKRPALITVALAPSWRCRPPPPHASSSWAPLADAASQLPGDANPARRRSSGDRLPGPPPATARTRSHPRAMATSSPSRSAREADRDQIDFFNARFGGAAAGAPVHAAPRRQAEDAPEPPSAAQSDVFEVEHYFGSSPTFVLDEPLRVKKDNIALTVPTWAPLLAADLRAHELVALLAAQGQLRQPKSLAPVRAGGAARGRSSSAAPTTAPGCCTRATYIPAST